MKKSLFFLSLFLLLISLSCGGGGSSSSGGGSVDTGNTPSISNLQMTQNQAKLNEGGGTVPVTLYFSFTDMGGDIVSLTLSFYDKNGNLFYSGLGSLHYEGGGYGATSGIIRVSGVNISTREAGKITLSVYLTDAGGRSSNALTGDFTIS